MAAIPVMIQGVMVFSDLGVGGGPMPGGPGVPPGYWGGVAPPHVDIGFPMPQPPTGQPPVYPAHPIAGGPWPSHPIAGPQPPQPQPPGIWPGPKPPYVDIGGPGPQPTPTPPIYFPPPGSQPPLGIWGGPFDPPRPTHPIVLPPNLPPETPETGPIDWKVGWTPTTGWVVIGVPNGPHPAPSA
jgi:hypothetical protein